MDYVLNNIEFEIDKLVADSVMNLVSKNINVGPLFIMIMDALLNDVEKEVTPMEGNAVTVTRSSLEISFNIRLDNIDESIKFFLNKYRKSTDDIINCLNERFNISIPEGYNNSSEYIFESIYEEIFNIYRKCVDIMLKYVNDENFKTYMNLDTEDTAFIDFYASSDYKNIYESLNIPLLDDEGSELSDDFIIRFYWPEMHDGSLIILAFTYFNFMKTKSIVTENGKTQKIKIPY